MRSALLSSMLGLTLAVGTVAVSTTFAPASSTSDGPAQVEGATSAETSGLAGDNLVENGDFEDGASGWKVIARGGQVTVDDTGRSGSAGLVVTATAATDVRAVHDLGDHPLPTGSHVDAWAWLRASVVSQEVKLTLDEIFPDGGYQPVHETIRTYDRAWETIRTTAVTEQPGSRLRLRIDVKNLPAGATIRLDDIWVAQKTRPTVQAGASSQRLDNGCAISDRGVPVCSAYFGAAVNLDDDPTAWEASMGRPLGLRRTYYVADQVDKAVETVRRDLAAGRLPWISFELPYSWADMAVGRGDRWVLAVSRRLAEVDGPVWVAFHHEPEGDGDVRDWTAMQQRLAPMVRSTASNVGYTIILTGWNQFHGDRQYRLRSIWPHGTEIDVAGFDLFNRQGVRKSGVLQRRTTPLSKLYFAPLAEWARKQGVAWAIAETGYTDTAAEQDPAWLHRTYQQLLHHGGVAFTYFNATGDGSGPWSIGTPQKRAQFADALQPTPRL